MHIYSIYTSPEDNKEPIIIQQGHSYIAGIFNIIWALYNRMWSIAFITVMANIVLETMANAFGSSSFSFASNIIIATFYILFASDLQEYAAICNGYKLSDIVVAPNSEEAEMKFYVRLTGWKGNGYPS